MKKVKSYIRTPDVNPKEPEHMYSIPIEQDNTIKYIYRISFVPTITNMCGTLMIDQLPRVCKIGNRIGVEEPDHTIIIISKEEINDSIDTLPILREDEDYSQVAWGGNKPSYFYQNPCTSSNWKDFLIKNILLRHLYEIFNTFGNVPLASRHYEDQRYKDIVKSMMYASGCKETDINIFIDYIGRQTRLPPLFVLPMHDAVRKAIALCRFEDGKIFYSEKYIVDGKEFSVVPTAASLHDYLGIKLTKGN